MVGQCNCGSSKKAKQYFQWPPIYNLGYNMIENEIYDDGTMYIYCYEYSAGHEGFVIQINNLTPGKTYAFSMNYQWTSASFFGAGNYRVGYNFFQSTAYSTAINHSGAYTTSWTDNLARDTSPHQTSMTFVPETSVMYLSFIGNGCSDSTKNYLKCLNMKIMESA